MYMSLLPKRGAIEDRITSLLSALAKKAYEYKFNNSNKVRINAGKILIETDDSGNRISDAGEDIETIVYTRASITPYLDGVDCFFINDKTKYYCGTLKTSRSKPEELQLTFNKEQIDDLMKKLFRLSLFYLNDVRVKDNIVESHINGFCIEKISKDRSINHTNYLTAVKKGFNNFSIERTTSYPNGGFIEDWFNSVKEMYNYLDKSSTVNVAYQYKPTGNSRSYMSGEVDLNISISDFNKFNKKLSNSNIEIIIDIPMELFNNYMRAYNIQFWGYNYYFNFSSYITNSKKFQNLSIYCSSRNGRINSGNLAYNKDVFPLRLIIKTNEVYLYKKINDDYQKIYSTSLPINILFPFIADQKNDRIAFYIGINFYQAINPNSVNIPIEIKFDASGIIDKDLRYVTQQIVSKDGKLNINYLPFDIKHGGMK